jgi:hypothetical protein
LIVQIRDDLKKLTFAAAQMALNYKKIAYRTEWLRFDEVGQKIKDL